MNRILICGPKGYDKLNYVKEVFEIDDFEPNQVVGFSETESDVQTGIVIEHIPVTTRYYKTNVGIFVDEPDTNHPGKFVDWIKELSGEEMVELREQLQLIIILLPKEEDYSINYEEHVEESVDILRTLLDTEYCSQHPNNLQWDGEIHVISVDDNELVSETRSAIQCTIWRDIQLSTDDTIHTIQQEQPPIPSEEDQLAAFERDIERLRNARERRRLRPPEVGEPGDGEDTPAGITAEEKQLVEDILNRVTQY